MRDGRSSTVHNAVEVTRGRPDGAGGERKATLLPGSAGSRVERATTMTVETVPRTNN